MNESGGNALRVAKQNSEGSLIVRLKSRIRSGTAARCAPLKWGIENITGGIKECFKSILMRKNIREGIRAKVRKKGAAMWGRRAVGARWEQKHSMGTRHKEKKRRGGVWMRFQTANKRKEGEEKE